MVIGLHLERRDEPTELEATDEDFRFATAVAAWGMLLRGSAYAGSATSMGILQLAEKIVEILREDLGVVVTAEVLRGRPRGRAGQPPDLADPGVEGGDAGRDVRREPASRCRW